MAVLGTALAKELLGFDDANKAFRPWWDTTQDFLMYGMVVLGTPLLMNFFIDFKLKTVVVRIKRLLIDKSDFFKIRILYIIFIQII